MFHTLISMLVIMQVCVSQTALGYANLLRDTSLTLLSFILAYILYIMIQRVHIVRNNSFIANKIVRLTAFRTSKELGRLQIMFIIYS